MRQTKKSKHIGRTVLIVLLALVLLCIYCFFSVKNFNKAFDKKSTVYFNITIPEGSSTTKIGNILQENGVISSSLVFKIKSRLNSLDGSFQAGEYRLSPAMTMNEIMETLQHARARQVKMTIAEGWTLFQVADALVEQGLISDTDEFYDALEDEYNYDFLPSLGTDVKNLSARANRLEGFLYPETYYIDEGSNAHTLIDTMLNQFKNKFTQEYISKIPEGYSIKDIITLASIIEEECGVDEERSIISGVFWNRLKLPMRLQSDVTIIYALDDGQEFSTSLNSPYNTYKVDGLPAGPICSPSIKSIDAALNPTTHNYYYFVLVGDGSGKCNFASTYEEHIKNVEIWRKNSKNQ